MLYIALGLVLFSAVFLLWLIDVFTFGKNESKPKEEVKHLYTGASALMLPRGDICWTSSKRWLSEELRKEYCQLSIDKNCSARRPIG